MQKLLPVALFIFLVTLSSLAWGGNYDLEKITDGVYVALARPEGKAASNVLVIMTPYQVVVAGAHFVPEGINDLRAEVAKITPLPIRSIILTHHHRGFNFVDFDFPANAEVIVSYPAWQSLESESRQIRNNMTVFGRGLTLKRDGVTIDLTSAEYGHSEGDVFVYLPDKRVLFTSDLFFNDVIGFMGDGNLRDWALTLERLARIDARFVVPGLGVVTDTAGIRRFQEFFKDFSTEILLRVEKGEGLNEIKKKFSLPKYENLPGYKVFLEVNIERAFRQLQR